MKRILYKKLLQWKKAKKRKPLILKGARQTGKTYLLSEFGNNEFSTLHYLNFQQDSILSTMFEKNLNPLEILAQIEFYLDKKIHIDSDILFFDEIQDCPRALTSLKFFCEDLPEMAVVCASSLLEVLHTSEPFPAGKVKLLNLKPLAFEEFLLALEDTQGYKALKKVKNEIPECLHQHLLERLKEYMVIGGMPEVITEYLSVPRGDKLTAFNKVREKQQELLITYMGDFSKYSGKVKANEIVNVFESIPSQLEQGNKKFKVSEVIKGGRFSVLCSAIDWLVGAGLVIKVNICQSGELPLSASTTENRFKLYLCDTGLLGAMAGLPPRELMLTHNLFLPLRGGFCENFVAQEFSYAGCSTLYSWCRNTAEIEFIREIRGKVHPFEVKAGLSNKLKSLHVFTRKYDSPCMTRLGTRGLEINKKEKMYYLPLYLAFRYPL